MEEKQHFDEAFKDTKQTKARLTVIRIITSKQIEVKIRTTNKSTTILSPLVTIIALVPMTTNITLVG